MQKLIYSDRWLAYTSALVTMFSFVFGTFTQQLITYVDFPITSGILQPKCVDRVEYYTFDIADEVPLALKAAAYNGILSPNIQPLPASCPIGNCTWPTTASLAICGGCSNSTYQQSCNSTADELDDVCSYTMPSGEVANLSHSSGGSGFQVMQSKGAAYNSSNSSMLYIINFDLVGAPGNSLEYTWSPSNTVAAECTMWFCVQAYDISVFNTQQTQFSQNFSRVVDPNYEGILSNFTFLDLPAEMGQGHDSQFNITC